MDELNPATALSPPSPIPDTVNTTNPLNTTQTYDMTPTIEATNMEDGERVLSQIAPHVLKKTGNQGKKGIINIFTVSRGVWQEYRRQ